MPAALAADLYLPVGTGPWPTILIQTPYDKNRYHDLGLPLPSESYAWVILDWRGHFGSSGTPDDPSKLGEDGDATYEQVAIPLLVVAGWYDLDPGDVLDAFHQLTLRSAPAFGPATSPGTRSS